MPGSGVPIAGVSAQSIAVPWIEKFRPASLDEIASQNDVIGTIKRLTDTSRLSHVLFYGPPGTGKTSTILAVARQLYGSAMNHMVLELNASDERGISVVRQDIQDFASTKQLNGFPFKLVILDECDAMTNDAQFALRRVIEKFAYCTRFCLICNYVSKVIPGLQSRCTRLRFAPLPHTVMRQQLDAIVSAEGIRIDEEGLNALIEVSRGDMRRSINILQCCHLLSRQVSRHTVYTCTGALPPEDVQLIMQTLLDTSVSVSDAFELVRSLQISRGITLADLARSLHTIVTQSSALSTARKVRIVVCLADIEYRLACRSNEELQLGAIISSFSVK
jgi:replication factor C subunit 3/5